MNADEPQLGGTRAGKPGPGGAPREYSYRRPWYTIPAGACFVIVLFYTGIGNVLAGFLIDDERLPIWVRVGVVLFGTACVVLGCGMLRSTLRVFRNRRTKQTIKLSESAIEGPKAPLSPNLVSIPLNDIRQIRLVDWFGRKTLQVRGSRRHRLSVSSRELASPETIDRLAADLAEASGVQVQRRVYRPGQFSLRTILLVITAAAVVMGLCIYFRPGRPPHEHIVVWVMMLVILSPVLLLIWAFSFTRRVLWRVFAVGYAAGAGVEWAAQSYGLSQGAFQNWPPTGWHPIALPLIRLCCPSSYQATDVDLFGGPVVCIFGAYAVSGVLFGAAFLVLWLVVGQWRRVGTHGKMDVPTEHSGESDV